MKNEHEKKEEEFVFNDENSASDIELEEIEDSEHGKLKRLREKLKKSEEERREQLEMLQRVRADFLNSKRRLEEQLEKDRQRITIEHITGLLPICDSFEIAMMDQDAWESSEETWRKGITGIYAQFMQLLKTYGVETIEPIGKRFDPYEHEAVANEKAKDESEKDTVISVMQKGYRLNDTVIRPPKVIVGA